MYLYNYSGQDSTNLRDQDMCLAASKVPQAVNTPNTPINS